MTRPSFEQYEAASPNHSCWVEASAGTGKTKVLTDRVLNLLLTGAEPEKILCLTFTKAAAAEMANRIQKHLATWAALTEADLSMTLSNLLNRSPKATEIKRAQQLFSKIIDAPGGLQIQTIHAFCQTVLKKFPLEANLPPHFTIVDDIKARTLLTDAFHQTLTLLPEDTTHTLSLHASVPQLFTLLQSLSHKRRSLETLIQQASSLEDLQKKIYTSLNIPAGTTPLGVLEGSLSNDSVPHAALKTMLPILENGSIKEQKIFDVLDPWLILTPEDRAKNFEAYKHLFLTTTGSLRKSFLSAKLVKANPAWHDIFVQEGERLLRLQERYHHALIAEASSAFLTFALLCFNHYKQLKKEEALLDYDDLIDATGKLFRKQDIAPWILYKLDGGIQHVLVDEAQDTSENQWEVIAAIVSEFFSEAFDPDNPKTLFVVGDMKQSIYSFQGASPAAFQEVKGLFSSASQEGNHQWKDIQLATSFRSTEPVLTLVDEVFAENASLTPQGVSLPYTTHKAHRTDHPGLVEVWPLIKQEEKEERDAWELPIHQKSTQSPRKQLAYKIAKTIRGWLTTNHPLPSQNRAIQPKDIMILVRRRDQFVEELVRALKTYHVPVTGIDRLVLSEHIGIMDLLTLGDFLLLPEDDLSLATILKSPLVGITEEDLFTLAYDRGGKSLWHRLKERASTSHAYQQAFEFLSDLLKQVDFSAPYELFLSILTKGGRQKMIQRLGTEVDDALDEFLNLCLSFEQDHTGSLQEFLAWMRQESIEIKRNLEQSSENKVRIMTVHGSKGLQAPIVFLPDTTQVPTNRSTFFWEDTDPENLALFWCPKSKYKTSYIQKLHPQFDEMAEYYRLLYVALTRAEDQLYVCGWETKTADLEKTWYHKVKEAAEKIGAPFDHEGEEGLRVSNSDAPITTTLQEEVEKSEAITLPTWVTIPAKTEAPAKRISPSTLGAYQPAKEKTHNDSALSAAERGTIIHKVFEWSLKAPQTETLRAYLETKGLKVEATKILSMVHRLKESCLQPYLSTGDMLTEVPLQMQDQKNNAITHGIMDLLWVNDTEAHIIDFKTGHFDPSYETTPPEIYQKQMNLYKEVVKKIYPDHTVRTFLLWTEIEQLLEVL